MVYAERLLSSWGNGILICARHRVPTRSVPRKHARHWVPGELPWWTCHRGCLLVAGGLSTSCVTSPREDSWKFALAFPWTSFRVPFSFADFVLCPFPVLDLSGEYDSMLRSVSPPSEPLNLGVILGTPNSLLLDYI